MIAFPLNVYAGALAGGFLAASLSLPWWRAWCRRVGLVDDPGHRKIHAQPMPLAGGLAVFTGLGVPLLVAVLALQAGWLDPDTTRTLGYGLDRRKTQLGAILLGALATMLLGILDDRHELRPAVKFGGQVLVAALLVASGIRITLFVPSAVFSALITVLWVVTLINAFNFMDNMNGLCTGLGAIGAWCFAWKAAVAGQFLVALIAFLAFGALLGFLPYNFPRASAFLGDAGSHLTGYLLAVLAILPHFYSPERPQALAVFEPLLVLAVPLADLVWVVMLRWHMGKPFYVGDTNHLSHRLERRGCSRTLAVLVIWLLAALSGAIAFL